MGLDRIKTVWSRLKPSSYRSKVVIVGGTNGKGSTIAMIESTMLSLGYSVGSYTSPHIHDYNERVRINGSNVSDDSLIQAFEAVEKARGDVALTYFEFGTLAAFLILVNKGLDVVLLEVGLGGRLDAVNIVEPDISIITSVDLDHTEWLGNCVNGIGREKAGILRNNKIALLGEDLPSSVYEISEELNVHSFSVGVDIKVNSGQVYLCAPEGMRQLGELPETSLPENNVLLAVRGVYCLLEQLCPDFDCDDVYKCFERSVEQLVLPGRLEEVQTEDGCFFLDVAHNPHAARHLATFVNKHLVQGKRIQAVYSSLGDKDVKGVIQCLVPFVEQWYLAPLDVHRAIRKEELEREVGDAPKSVLSFDSMDQALEAAAETMQKNNTAGAQTITLIFGSFYVVEAAKVYFNQHERHH